MDFFPLTRRNFRRLLAAFCDWRAAVWESRRDRFAEDQPPEALTIEAVIRAQKEINRRRALAVSRIKGARHDGDWLLP